MSDERKARTCRGCGYTDYANLPVPDHCGECPPYECDECGGTNHLAENVSCACWTSVENVPLADLKGMFAGSGMNVGTDGRITT